MRFSIILPVYNVEKYLSECIDSLLNQCFMTLGVDYELIFVNDGSTDHSLNILKRRRSEIMGGYLIVNQYNSGVSVARNAGLKYAKGDYVWFVDPDDLIASESLFWATEILKQKPYLKSIRYYNLRIAENIDPIKLLSKVHAPKTPQAPTAFSLIVNRKHLMDNNITFNQSMSYGEDTLWVFNVNFLAGNEYVADGGKVNYFYRVREGSAMQTRNTDSRIKHLKSMETMLTEYERILIERESQLTGAQIRHLRKRIDWSVQNVLFDSLQTLQKAEQRELFNRVAYKQYTLNWGRLSTRYGIKPLLVNIIGLPLKYKIYYNIIGGLMSLMR